MPNGIHKRTQTAFRLREDLKTWLEEQAGHEGPDVTMTAIVERALEAERARCTAKTSS
jgi:hypothetical protein